MFSPRIPEGMSNKTKLNTFKNDLVGIYTSFKIPQEKDRIDK